MEKNVLPQKIGSKNDEDIFFGDRTFLARI